MLRSNVLLFYPRRCPLAAVAGAVSDAAGCALVKPAPFVAELGAAPGGAEYVAVTPGQLAAASVVVSATILAAPQALVALAAVAANYVSASLCSLGSPLAAFAASGTAGAGSCHFYWRHPWTSNGRFGLRSANSDARVRGTTLAPVALPRQRRVAEVVAAEAQRLAYCFAPLLHFPAASDHWQVDEPNRVLDCRPIQLAVHWKRLEKRRHPIHHRVVCPYSYLPPDLFGRRQTQIQVYPINVRANCPHFSSPCPYLCLYPYPYPCPYLCLSLRDHVVHTGQVDLALSLVSL